MSAYFDNLISNLGNQQDQQINSDKRHFLFLLGTGVDYVPGPCQSSFGPKFYTRGNTLSCAAQLTTLLEDKNEKAVITANSPHPYHSSSADVINGVGLAAQEAGDRIARSLLLALDAIAQGKTEINISGFSRGAAESMVLAHELQRVLDTLKTDAALDPKKRRPLASIIAESKSCRSMGWNSTKDKLTALIGDSKLDQGIDNAMKDKLLHNFENPALDIKLFTIDPVPGDFDRLLKAINWDEPEGYFDYLPPIIKEGNSKGFIAQHETSTHFKVINPVGMNSEVNPGIHGHGDGAQGNHNEDKVGDLSSVQDRVWVGWLDFFFSEYKHNKEKIDLKHPELDALTNTYFSADKAARRTQLLGIYNRMLDNLPDFKKLEKDNYTGLGRPYETRKVRNGKKHDCDIYDLNPHGDYKFVNQEHLDLWLENKMEEVASIKRELPDQIEWLMENFRYAFEPHEEKENIHGSLVDKTDLMDTLLKAERRGQCLVEPWLADRVNVFTQTYLDNHLNKANTSNCENCVKNIFAILLTAKNSTDAITSKRAESLNITIRQKLTETMLQYQDALFTSSVNHFNCKFENTEQAKLDWLIKTQQLIEDLETFNQKMKTVMDGCDFEILKKKWNTLTPGIENHSDIKVVMQSHIMAQQEVLKQSASKVLEKMEALNVKPDTLSVLFYTDIQLRANSPRNAAEVKVLRMEVLKQDKEISQKKYEILAMQATHGEKIKNLTLEHQTALQNKDIKHAATVEELNAQIEQLKAQNLQLREQNQQLDNENQLQQVQIENNQNSYQVSTQISTQKTSLLLNKALSDDQEKNNRIVRYLRKRVTTYQTHLNNSNDGSTKHQAKQAAVTNMLAALNAPDTLAVDKLNNYRTQMNNANAALKAYRDPEWTRFFIDCIRNLARLASFVWVYELMDGKNPFYFFKASGGKALMDDSTNALRHRIASRGEI